VLHSGEGALEERDSCTTRFPLRNARRQLFVVALRRRFYEHPVVTRIGAFMLRKALLILVLLMASGCSQMRAEIQKAQTEALRPHIQSAVRAMALATPELRAACSAEISKKTSDWAPKHPLVALPTAAQWIQSDWTKALRGIRPQKGGELVVFAAPYDVVGLFGRKTASVGGCAYELVGDRLIFLEALYAPDFTRTTVIAY
jgi:hypothetical protein